MAAETGLLVAGELLLVAATATGVVSLRPGGDDRDGPWARASSWLSIAAAIPVTLASLLLMVYFLLPDLTVHYVWSYTSILYPWYYRLAGFWGGQDGSLLLWAWLGVGLLSATDWVQRERRHDAWPIARIVVLLIGVVLLWIVIDLDPFVATPQALLARSPQGSGISPLLLSPFMLVHPPIQFLGYAMAAFPVGYAAAYLLADRDWVEPTLYWVRRYWMVLTAAVGLGGLWAYYVLSFGGYWAWDPVETSNLLPWIVLTLGLHAVIFHKRRGQYEHLAPFALIATYALVWFATFVTRSGMWVSVHSFVVESSSIQDPLLRFSSIVHRSPLAAQTLKVALGAVLLTGVVFLLRFARRSEEGSVGRAFHLGYAGFVLIVLGVAAIDVEGFVRFGFEAGRVIWPGEPGFGAMIVAGVAAGLPPLVRVMAQSEEEVIEVDSIAELVTERNLVLVSVLLLFTAFSTTLLLLLLGINGTQPAVYDSRAPYIAIPIAVALSVLFLHERIGRRRALIAGVGAGVAGAGMGLVTDPPVLGLGLPVLLLATGAGYAKILEVLGVDGWPTDRRQWSGALMLLSGLLGVAMWASPPSTIPLGVAAFEPGLVASLVGLAFSVATIAGAVVWIRDGPRQAPWAVVTGLVSLGWYVGAVMAVAAAVVGWRAPTRDLSVRAHLGRAGTWVIHLGVVLLMVGYGTSTFFEAQREWDQTDPAARGIEESWRDYTFTFVGAEGEETLDQGFYDRMWATVEIRQDGEVVDQGRMLLYWGDATSNYVPQVYVSRGLTRDVYLVPDGYHTPEEGWVMANGQDTRFETDDVDRIAMRALELPGVNLLWAGYVLMLVGIGTVVATERRR